MDAVRPRDRRRRLSGFAFEGPAPLNLIDANVRGTGKSLLADVCTTILTGRPVARMSYSRDEDELRKAVTSMAVEAPQGLLIHNVSGNFGSPAAWAGSCALSATASSAAPRSSRSAARRAACCGGSVSLGRASRRCDQCLGC